MALTSPWSRLIAEKLHALGIELHIVDLQPKGNESRGYLTGTAAARESIADLESRVAGVHRVAPPESVLPRLIRSARAVRRIARQTNADVILSLYGGSLAAAAYLSRYRPYIVYVVGSDVLLANQFEKWMARLSLPAAAAVIANGKSLASKASQLAPSAKISVLYMGADLERFSFVEKKKPSLRFVCSRGFLPVYDNATIIRALGKLESVPSDFEISFLSSGPLLAASKVLADQVVNAAVRKMIVFRGGVSDSGVRDALQSASYYLSASLSDGASSSLFEAMACGLFPIVSDIPANREWVTHEKNGLLFPAGDASYLSECIKRVIAGESWMMKARSDNRRLVEEHANIRVSTRNIAQLLSSESEKRNQE